MAQISSTRLACNGRKIWHACFFSYFNSWWSKLFMMRRNYTYRTYGTKIDASLTKNDCHVECTTLFHARLQKILHSYILLVARILGYVEEYVFRYGIQFCGSLHAHIILWIEKWDVEHIANEITATVPVVFDTTHNFFLNLQIHIRIGCSKKSCENNCIHVVHDVITKKCRYL